MSGLTESPYVVDQIAGPAHDQGRWGGAAGEPAEIILVVENKRLAAQVADQSLSGVEVLVDGNLQLAPLKTIDMVYLGLPVQGAVRSTGREEGRTRLEIAWVARRTESPGLRPRCRVKSDFFRAAGFRAACRIVEPAGKKIRVRLPSRMVVEVEPDQLTTIGRFERLAELKERPEQLPHLAAVYQLGALSSVCDTLREVLNLEFAPGWD